jgi:hypothetical protein
VGIINESAATVQSLPLSGTGIFDFDGDGLCTDSLAPPGCQFGTTGYEGPGITFTLDPGGSVDIGTVNFAGGLALGAIAYSRLKDRRRASFRPRRRSQPFRRRGSRPARPIFRGR